MKPIFGRAPPLGLRLALSIIASVALIISDGQINAMIKTRSFMETAVGGLYYLANSPRTVLDSVSDNLVDTNKLQIENRVLKDQLREKNADLLLLDQLKVENQRLRLLLNSPLRQDEYKKIGEVLTAETDTYRQQVVINQGKNDGAYVGQPVIDEKGVIGQIISVGETTCRVLLLTDVTHSLPVQVLRNDVRLIASGTGRTDELRLENVSRSTDIEKGDLLVTSGLGGRFPEGYPVAVVENVSRDGQNYFATITAKPLASLERLRYILLLWPTGEEIRKANSLSPEDVRNAVRQRMENQNEIAKEKVSEQAARSALKSLQGEFSNKVNQLVEQVIYLRTYVEAAIDFPDEEIDFLADGKIEGLLHDIIVQLDKVRREAKQGSILREGMKVVIAGRPNAGKSSLLNALAGREAAIVTEIAGTTRDVLREHIHLDGMPLHIIDTAGLREATDEVERIGINRAWNEIEQADRILLMLDSTQPDNQTLTKVRSEFLQKLPENIPVTIIRNKADLSHEAEGIEEADGYTVIRLSAKTQRGVQLLREHLKQAMGFQSGTEGGFLARRRHLQALEQAAEHLNAGHIQLTRFRAGELLAEELRLTQNALSEITGQFTSDDLLTSIFSSFCIGK